MALTERSSVTERLSVMDRSSVTERSSVTQTRHSRSNSQCSDDTELNNCDRHNAITVSTNSPMSLARIISTTFKHSPNLLIPHPPFLRLLKTVGAKSDHCFQGLEIYSVQKLCFYLKEYIKEKMLYDHEEVHVVYCNNDPIRDVFHVDKFTIHDVLDLILKVSTRLPIGQNTTKSLVSSSPKTTDLQQSGIQKSPNDIEGLSTRCVDKQGIELSPKRSASNVNLPRLSRKRSSRESESSCDVTSTTDSSKRIGLKRPLDEEQDKGQLSEKRFCTGKSEVDSWKMEANVTDHALRFLSKTDNAATVFKDDFSDAESIYSVQSKETALVKDSSDDLWFLKDDDDDDDHDTDDISYIYADEYDIASNLSHGSSSEFEDDIEDFDEDGIFVRQQDLCDESETDFADGELSDWEEEKNPRLSAEASHISWQCIKCHHRNRNPDRLCDGCLNVRTEELLQGTCHLDSSSSSDDSSAVGATYSVERLCRSSRTANSDNSKSILSVDPTAESHSSQMTSSQESGFLSFDSEDTVTPELCSQNSVTVTNLKVKETTSGFKEDVLENDNIVQISGSGNLCIICLLEPKVASLLHGSSGHQACCYQCACQLKRMRKPCPVCRQQIQKVIRNYVV